MTIRLSITMIIIIEVDKENLIDTEIDNVDEDVYDIIM